MEKNLQNRRKDGAFFPSVKLTGAQQSRVKGGAHVWGNEGGAGGKPSEILLVRSTRRKRRAHFKLNWELHPERKRRGSEAKGLAGIHFS